MTAPPTVIIGRRSTTPDDHYGDMGASEIRAYVANNAPADVWIRRARYRGGRTGGSTPRVRVAVYDTAGGGPAPDDLLYTFPSTYPSTRMDDANGGELVTVNVDSATKAFLLNGGLNYALALQVNDAGFRHNMIEAADISGENEQFYYRSASNPPNPYGSSTVSTEGWITLWLEGDQNLAPLAPIGISPSGQTLSVTPTIEADFRDPNGAYGATAYGATNYDAGDYVASARIKVRRKSDGVSFWDHTYTTTSGERTANRTSKVYAGTTLIRGTTYQVQVQHFDRNGDSSPSSAWVDFTPGSLGVVTTTGNPFGKTDDMTPNVDWSWFHGTGLSADRVRVKFYRGNASTPSATSSDMTVAVATGASAVALWSSMGIATALIPGQAYYYTVEARATDLVWSQPSAKRLFTVDAAPGVPVDLSPATGEVRSTATYPVLSAKITDDDDTNATGKTGFVEILTSGGVLIGTAHAATLRAGTTDIYDYQTTAADLAAPGTYRHRWYSYDGYLYSGGVETSGAASRSAEAVFSWAAVPSPVITAPLGGSTLTTVQPTIAWTVTSQDKFRARILQGGVEIFSSGEVSNTGARSYTFPVGYTRNGQTYDFEVGVQFSSLWGYDTETAVLIAYDPPPSLGTFQVLPGVVNLEPIATAAVGTWDVPITEYFESITIYRDDLGDRPFLEIRNIELNTFTDYHAPNNAVYTGVLNELRGLDEIVSSEPVTMNVTLGIRGVVLVSIANPQVDRYVNSAWEAIEWIAQGDESTYFTWGSEKPISKRGIADWMEGSQEFKLNAEIVDPEVARAALEALSRSNGFSYRDKYDRRFATMPVGSLQMTRLRGGGWQGSFDLREVEVTEGVEE